MAKILIVDDSAFAQRTMRRILEASGHQVITAENGSTGLEKYFLEKPDLVVLDLTMPDMNGLDVLKKLRELDANARVIIASADIQTSSKALAQEAGALDFITKPFDVESVVSTLNAALAR